MLRHTLTAAALAAVLAAPAFAQTANPDTKSDTMAPPSTAQMNRPDAAETTSKPNASQTVQSQGLQLTEPGRNTFVQTQHATDWRGSKVIGATVYGPDNASIGNVNDVLIDNEGRIRAVVIGVGGFLGVGEKDVAIPFDTLHIVRKPESSSIDKITVSYSKDELKNAPKFAWYEPSPSQTTGSGVTDKLKSLNPMSDKK